MNLADPVVLIYSFLILLGLIALLILLRVLFFSYRAPLGWSERLTESKTPRPEHARPEPPEEDASESLPERHHPRPDHRDEDERP